jgi:uncharacterized Zn finger protein
MARTYDPGTATRPVKVADGLYSIDSFRGEETSYLVDLRSGSCTCPHYQKRIAGTSGACKHVKAARAARFLSLTEKARTVPTEILPALLAKHEQEGRLDVALAIRSELFDRQQVAA